MPQRRPTEATKVSCVAGVRRVQRVTRRTGHRQDFRVSMDLRFGIGQDIEKMVTLVALFM